MTTKLGFADKFGYFDKYVNALWCEVAGGKSCRCYDPNTKYDCQIIKGCKVKDVRLLESVISALLKVKCKHKFYEEILYCICRLENYNSMSLYSLCSDEDKREILKLNTCWNQYMLKYITLENKDLYKDSIIDYCIKNNHSPYSYSYYDSIGDILMLYEYDELERLVKDKDVNNLIYKTNKFTPIMMVKKYPNINEDDIDCYLFKHKIFLDYNKLEHIEYILENYNNIVLVKALILSTISYNDKIELLKKFIIRTNNINNEVFSIVFYYDYVEIVEFLYSYRVFDNISFTINWDIEFNWVIDHKSLLLLEKMGYNYTKNNFIEIIKNRTIVDKKLLEKYNLDNDGDILVCIAKMYKISLSINIIADFIDKKEKKLIGILSKKSKNINVFVKEYEKKIYENHVPTRMLMLCVLINNLHDELIPILVKKGGEILPEYMALYEPVIWKYIDNNYKFEKK